MIEIINQILTTMMLLAATILIITVTIILIKHGRRTEGERPRPPQIRPVQPQVEPTPPTPPPAKPQETQTTEGGTQEQKEYSWVLNLDEEKKATQTSSSST